MAEPQKDMSGVLFRNDRRRDGKQDPNLQDSFTIDGRRYCLDEHHAARERRGDRYISLSFRAAEERQEHAAGRDDDALLF